MGKDSLLSALPTYSVTIPGHVAGSVRCWAGQGPCRNPWALGFAVSSAFGVLLCKQWLKPLPRCFLPLPRAHFQERRLLRPGTPLVDPVTSLVQREPEPLGAVVGFRNRPRPASEGRRWQAACPFDATLGPRLGTYPRVPPLSRPKVTSLRDGPLASTQAAPASVSRAALEHSHPVCSAITPPSRCEWS